MTKKNGYERVAEVSFVTCAAIFAPQSTNLTLTYLSQRLQPFENSSFPSESTFEMPWDLIQLNDGEEVGTGRPYDFKLTFFLEPFVV